MDLTKLVLWQVQIHFPRYPAEEVFASKSEAIFCSGAGKTGLLFQFGIISKIAKIMVNNKVDISFEFCGHNRV